MAESSPTQEAPKTAELPSFSPEVKLITGVHPLSKKDSDAISNRLKNEGDLKAHNWPHSVTEKLLKIPKGVDVLAIDSLAPGGGTDIERKLSIWRHLPSSPSEFNPNSNHVSVVLADTNYYRPIVQKFYDANLDEGKKSQDTVDILNRDNSNIDNIDNTGVYQIPAPIAWPVEIGFIIGLASVAKYAEVKLDQVINPDPVNPKTHSRRRFLQFAGIVAATLAGGVLGTREITKIVPKKYVEIDKKDSQLDLLKKIVEGKFVNKNTVADFTTALLIAKSISAANKLHAPRAAVILGSFHEHNKNDLLDSEEARTLAIQHGALQLRDILDEASTAIDLSKDKKQEVWDVFLDYIASAQIVTVTDPGIKKVPASEVNSVINKAVQFEEKSFQSEEVLRALEPIRQLPAPPSIPVF